jgi:uncharacterized protein
MGRVTHRRFQPVEHRFNFPLMMLYLDLAELPRLFQGRWLWSAEHPAFAWFRRADYLGPRELSLDEAIRTRVQAATGQRPRGRVCVLSNLRNAGHIFNPVTFYYCFQPDDDVACGHEGRLEAIVAEITNTPWMERHAYVLDARTHDEQPSPDNPPHRTGQTSVLRWGFEKAFHVSPFMPMDLEYDWAFSTPLEREGSPLGVHMRLRRNGCEVFDATLALRRRAITPGTLAGALMRYPLMTMQVVAAIHGHALRLWMKGARVHKHPGGIKTQAVLPTRILPGGPALAHAEPTT